MSLLLPTSSPSARPASRPRADGPGIPPLLPILAPVVIAAIVLGFLFTRYLSQLAPVRAEPSIRFADATAETGLRFRHEGGGAAGDDSPTTLGAGVAVIDYDRDGAPDLFFVNGAPWPWVEQPSLKPRAALYRNAGGGRFMDVTAETGAGLELQGMGAYAADYDADGWTDLFVTGVGTNRLLRNDGGRRFIDVTEQAGLAGDGHTWSTGALWLDLDEDGRLDLIVCVYTRWPREIELDVAFKIAGVGRSYGAPAGFVSASPAVYRNLGDGRFEEATERFGLRNLAPETRLPRGEPLGVAPVDVNGDARLDLLFSYHHGEPTLYLNDGDGRYREFVPPQERREGSGAGLLTLGAAAMSREKASPDLFQVIAAVGANGVGDAQRVPLRTSVALLDYDLDGRVDFFSGQAVAEPGINRFDGGRDFSTVPALWWNHGGRWKRPATGAGETVFPRLISRGVVTLDYDADGDQDVVVTQHGGPAKLFRNEQRVSTAWLKVRLVSRDGAAGGVGARVEVQTPRQKLTRVAMPRVGYLSQSEDVLTFGLGEDARVRRIVVTWPSGVRQEIAPEGINRVMVITEAR